MIPPGRDWEGAPGASDAALSELQASASGGLPAEYLELLAWSNGGEGPLPVQPFWLVLSSAEGALNEWTSGNFTDHFPNLFVFGTNGAGEAFAFNTTTTGPRVVYFDMTNIDLEESVVEIAPSMAAFIDLMGRDSA